MRQTAVILLLLIAVQGVWGREWDRVYGGPGLNEGRCIIPTPDGAYLVAGCLPPTDTTLQYGGLLKIDATGDTLWSHLYCGGRYAEINAVALTADGGYIAVGTCEANAGDFWILKLDAMGDTIWTRCYGGSNRDVAWSVIPASDGYLVVGYTQSFCQGAADGWVLKLNEIGDTLWSRSYGGAGSDQLRSVAPTGDGGFVLAGYTNSWGAGDFDAWIVRINPSGDTLWMRTFGGISGDAALHIAAASDGGSVVSGFTFAASGGYEAWVFKLDAFGSLQWNSMVRGTGNDAAWSVVPLPTGGYIAVGSTSSYGAGLRDAWIIRLDAAGSVLWSRTYGGMDDDEAYSVTLTADGGVMAAGYSNSFGPGNEEIYVVKLDSLGALDVNFAATKLPQQAELKAWSHRDRLTVRVQLPQSQSVSVQLLDLLGQRVADLHAGLLPAGSSTLEFELPKLQDGYYLIDSHGALPSAAIEFIK